MNPEPKNQELTKLLVLATVTSSFGTFQHGYSIWTIQNPAVTVLEFGNITSDKEDRSISAGSFAIVMFSFPLGGVLGSLALRYLVDNLGRKGALLLTNFFTMLSSALLGLSKVVNVFEYAVFSRFLSGICSGAFSNMVPLYIEEISPVNLRGSLTMVPTLFLNLGHLVAQTLGYHTLLGNPKGYPLLLGFSGIVAFLSFTLLLFCPESPRFLWIQKQKEGKAKKILQQLRGAEDVEDEIGDLRLEALAEKAERNMTVLKLLRCQQLRWHVISVVVLMVGIQIAGVIGVYDYSERIYNSAAADKRKNRFLTIGLNCLTFSVAFGTMYTVDSVGRRFLLLLGFMICNMSCILLALSLEIQAKVPSMIYVSGILLNVFFAGHMIGPGSIPYIVSGEIFLQSSRASAYVIGGFANWFSRILLGVIFVQMEPHIGPFSLFIFWPLSMATFVYIFKMIPETSCTTFLEIQKLMEVRIAERNM
ncbi:solute carrier family 2, facilitated glucose transporter member 5-like [Elgaria multicarinata webbii]|uniref:solute carrier family 2, facilitated glucose transporter member 5-like n=1 Tax=Elgaria multicarinata webbii TaxID=159646 RepID=UPI002FCD26BA